MVLLKKSLALLTAAFENKIRTDILQPMQDALPLLNKFPRSQKFLLADKIEHLFIELLELFTEAYYGQN